eukprot:6474066-Amphidinium_carterae.1
MSCAALCSTTARTTACDERTSAPGTSRPLPEWIPCSIGPMPSTGSVTQSEKGKINHSAKVAVGWDVDCLIEAQCEGREIVLLSGISPALVWRGA